MIDLTSSNGGTIGVVPSNIDYIEDARHVSITGTVNLTRIHFSSGQEVTVTETRDSVSELIQEWYANGP